VSGFGDRLRREREMRGVSIEEIAESTKIGTRSLRALEEEDFEKLPGGIFNKGFVRAYSRFLGLNEDQTVADFDAAWKEYEAARRPVQMPEPEEESAGESGANWLLAVALVLLVLLAAGWYFLKHRHRSGSREAVVAPRATDASQPPAPAPTDASLASSAAHALPPLPAPGPTTNDLKKAPSEVAKSVAAAEPAVTKKPEQGATTPRQADLNAPIQLEVFAREDSWLSVSADGKNLGQGVLTAQKSRTIRAQKEVRLKLGNVGGVEVSFNGRPINIDGEPKQVKELTFTPEGLHQ